MRSFSQQAEAASYLQEVGVWPLLQRPAPEGAPPALSPDLCDLARLHDLTRSRRVLNILEFGVGWSSLVFAHALSMNERDFGAEVVRDLRRSRPFVCFSVDDSDAYLETARARIPDDLQRFVEMSFSPVEIGTFNDRICTYYSKLPEFAADLVYVDGPSQLFIDGDLAGVTLTGVDRMPMAADLARFEHLLQPGTMVLLDGRAANARFLKSNLQRNWRFVEHEDLDVRTLELVEAPLGRFNRAQIELCLGRGWLSALEG